jgi:hypothetical protein
VWFNLCVYFDIWVIVSLTVFLGAVCYRLGTAVEGRRRSRAERANRAAWCREAVAQYVAGEQRITSLQDRVRAERVADALAEVAVRTAAATHPPGRREIEP